MIDCFSRRVLSWRLFSTIQADLCIEVAELCMEAVEEALRGSGFRNRG
ncbi:hypothetical protein ATO4_21532 [Aurantimonas sp. 22II-16-19i]|nr:hypothetical protein ATO4_21532 [Aurantimonas sp. 22II-16-19i]